MPWGLLAFSLSSFPLYLTVLTTTIFCQKKEEKNSPNVIIVKFSIIDFYSQFHTKFARANEKKKFIHNENTFQIRFQSQHLLQLSILAHKNYVFIQCNQWHCLKAKKFFTIFMISHKSHKLNQKSFQGHFF